MVVNQVDVSELNFYLDPELDVMTWQLCGHISRYYHSYRVTTSDTFITIHPIHLPTYPLFRIQPTMPPSRNHVPLHTSHNPPYSKDRAAGMTGPSRQSSTGALGGGGGVRSTMDKKPFSVDPTKSTTAGVESEEASKERKRKRKARRAAQGQLEGETNATVAVKSEDTDMKEGKVKSRPLASSTINPQSQTAINDTSSTITLSKPPSNAPQAQPVQNQNKIDSRLAKIEHKMEKQKMKLKEAEARAAADAEKLRTDAERIKELEESVKELRNALDAKEEAAVGVKTVVDEHVKVSLFGCPTCY